MFSIQFTTFIFLIAFDGMTLKKFGITLKPLGTLFEILVLPRSTSEIRFVTFNRDKNHCLMDETISKNTLSLKSAHIAEIIIGFLQQKYILLHSLHFETTPHSHPSFSKIKKGVLLLSS